MYKKIINYILVLVSLIAVLNVRTFDIHADETGSVIIDIIHQEDVDGKRIDTPIPGIKFDVYQVWTYDMSDKEDIKLLFNNSFKDITTIDASMSEDEIQKKTPLFVEKVEDAEKLMSVGPTDKNGQIVVDGLKQGVYLFVMDGVITYNNALYQVSPFMVSVPRKVDGEWLYDVKAYPKLGIVKDEPPLEKKVNGAYEYELKVDYEVVTYTLHTQMPKLAHEFKVYDTLEPVLEFAPFDTLDQLIEVKIGSYKLSLQELRKQVSIDGQTITVEFTKEQLEEYKEKDVVIAFGARIRRGADLTPYINKKVPNECEYEINNDFKKKSNIVPITPPPPPWNPPKTGILIVDTILGNPVYLIGFTIAVLVLIEEVFRRYRRQYR